MGSDVSTAISSADVSAEIASAQSILEDLALNPAGVAETFHTSGAIDRTNPFFESMGTNGRTCETCHDARSAWTTSAKVMSELFESTAGTHPLFVSLHDSGHPPRRADRQRSTRSATAFKTLLKFGVHRFTRTNHVGNDYDVIAVDDPVGLVDGGVVRQLPSRRHEHGQRQPGRVSHHHRHAQSGHSHAARRLDERRDGLPRPDDGPGPGRKARRGRELHARPVVRAVDRQRRGPLDAAGARGGPVNLAAEPYPVAGRFDLYDAWIDACGDGPGASHALQHAEPASASRSRAARSCSTTCQFQVSGVAGLNDELGIPVLTTTCNGCHRAKNVGSSTSIRFMDIGVAAESNRAEFLPLLTVQNRNTGEIRKTTDLGPRAQHAAVGGHRQGSRAGCAVSPRARRISTPVRPRPSARSSTSTPIASTSA